MARWPPLISEVVCFQGMRRKAPFCRHLAIEDRKPPGVVNTSCNQPDAELEALSGVRWPPLRWPGVSKATGAQLMLSKGLCSAFAEQEGAANEPVLSPC